MSSGVHVYSSPTLGENAVRVYYGEKDEPNDERFHSFYQYLNERFDRGPSDHFMAYPSSFLSQESQYIEGTLKTLSVASPGVYLVVEDKDELVDRILAVVPTYNDDQAKRPSATFYSFEVSPDLSSAGQLSKVGQSADGRGGEDMLLQPRDERAGSHLTRALSKVLRGRDCQLHLTEMFGNLCKRLSTEEDQTKAISWISEKMVFAFQEDGEFLSKNTPRRLMQLVAQDTYANSPEEFADQLQEAVKVESGYRVRHTACPVSAKDVLESFERHGASVATLFDKHDPSVWFAISQVDSDNATLLVARQQGKSWDLLDTDIRIIDGKISEAELCEAFARLISERKLTGLDYSTKSAWTEWSKSGIGAFARPWLDTLPVFEDASEQMVDSED